MSVDEKPDDDKDDGRVLIRGSSLRPTIRNWRKFEIDEKSGNTSTLISLPVLTATVPPHVVLHLGRLQGTAGILALFWGAVVNFA